MLDKDHAMVNNNHRMNEGGDAMVHKKRKRRKTKQAAQPDRVRQFLGNVLAGIVSGIIVAVIIKLLGW